jgi:hypothetical protein
MNNNYKNYNIKIVAFLMSIFMLITTPYVYGLTTTKLNTSVEDVISKTSQYIISSSESYENPWIILGLARSESQVDDEYYEKYYAYLKETLQNNDGVLSQRKYTDYSGAVLALSAIGKDPSNVGGYNLLEKLADFDAVVAQGINGAVWALLALDTCDYEIPYIDVENITTREKLIDYIVSHEISGGGWSMGEATPDPDVTAMVLQSLSKYYDSADVQDSIERGITLLSSIQQNDGGYESWETKNSESAAPVIVAMCSLGIDPQTDDMFVKGTDKNVVSNIINNFYVSSSGGFMHIEDTSVDGLATIQGFYSMVAYDRFSKEKSPLYDMSDVEKKYDDESQTSDTQQTENTYENKFTDIDTDPEKESIISLSAKGIINGMTETLFMPEDKITRAQFVALISRALELEETETDSFLDVSDENWFSGYVGAAESMEITVGYDDGTFKPDNYISRQEASLMIARAANILGVDTSLDSAEIINILCQFVDYIDCDDWSMEAMASCVKNGYIPDEDMNIYPKEDATRSEIAGMVYRMLK